VPHFFSRFKLSIGYQMSRTSPGCKLLITKKIKISNFCDCKRFDPFCGAQKLGRQSQRSATKWIEPPRELHTRDGPCIGTESWALWCQAARTMPLGIPLRGFRPLASPTLVRTRRYSPPRNDRGGGTPAARPRREPVERNRTAGGDTFPSAPVERHWEQHWGGPAESMAGERDIHQ